MESVAEGRRAVLFDPWETELNRRHGRHLLSSIEVTVTNRCNMRCRHCAVGETLVMEEPEHIPLERLFASLDQVETLRTLSITGGEPSENFKTLKGYVLPILQYAKRRGLKTQVNTNLTYDLERYELMAPYVDVLHITWNYPSLEAFHDIAWAHGREHVPLAASEKLYNRIISNTESLSKAGVFVSAESMINRDTAPHLGAMNRILAAMGCRRHEVHPMYPADWAASLDDMFLNLEQFRATVDRFLNERNPDLWVLFGTVPFFACSPNEADRAILNRMLSAPNVTVRNCPDGRSRLNINGFTGEIMVTDFADFPILGRIGETSLVDAFDSWLQHPAFGPYDCYCPSAGCTGPNPIVAQVFHPGVDFRGRKALS